MFSMNFDGYELVVEGNNCKDWIIGWSNVNNVDFNCNFFDQFFKSVIGFFQFEIIVVMKWIESYLFVLSVNFYGGFLVVNYLFDDSFIGQSEYSKFFDDDVFKELVKSYFMVYLIMYLKNLFWFCFEVFLDYFEDGVINGVVWYSVLGGMQDYNYMNFNCFEIIIEQGCKKFLEVSELFKDWEENK